jgi:hypothetical protein
MEVYLNRRKGVTSLSLIDCHAVTVTSQMSVAKSSSTRARSGFIGYEARPFAYTATDLAQSKAILKTPHAWKSVQPADTWSDTLTDKVPDPRVENKPNGQQRPQNQPRSADFDEGLSCVIM